MNMNNNIKKAIDEYLRKPYPFKIRCGIMDSDKGYYWGDKRFIPELLNIKNPGNKAFAELWIGAHKNAPSKAIINGIEISLFDLIENAGKKILGEKAYKQFGNNLPFLLKILSAAKPLSIQAHPDKKQAESGWKREKGKGPNYKDSNHKPELISALTDFWALNGFREINEIIKEFEKQDIRELNNYLIKLKSGLNHIINMTEKMAGAKKREILKKFYQSIMKIPQREKKNVIKKILKTAKTRYYLNNFFPFFLKNKYKYLREYWVIKAVKSVMLAIKNDIINGKLNIKEKDSKTIDALFGIINIYLLNLIKLNPGEAMFLPAGELHSYLNGSGVEIMANSDNVLRGGLTHKHIDIDELLNILTFESGMPEVLKPEKISETECKYIITADEFELGIIELSRGKMYESKRKHNAEAFIVLGGEVEVTDANRNKITASKGETFFIPYIIDKYFIKPKSGYSKLYKANIP